MFAVYVPRCSVDYFHKNSERNVGVVMQLLISAISLLGSTFLIIFIK